MKLKEVLYKTPEMTEEKLLEILRTYTHLMSKDASNRLSELYNKRHQEFNSDLAQIILEEWDLIQEKKSFLSKSQRDQICGLVSICLIQMTKGNEN